MYVACNVCNIFLINSLICRCKCKCKCRWMKFDYQKTFIKIARNIVSWKKTYWVIINLKNENWTLKMMKMRDLMNNALKNAKINLIVITVVKTQKRNNIVLMILKKYIANVLLAQRVIWEHVFDVKSIKKDEKWHKIIIHSLKINIFNMKIKMKNLKTELKSFNLELKLIINFIWLSKNENQSRNRHALMILTFKIEAEAQRYLKKWLLTARLTYQTVEYWDY